jgi:hypothetical protein
MSDVGPDYVLIKQKMSFEAAISGGKGVASANIRNDCYEGPSETPSPNLP